MCDGPIISLSCLPNYFQSILNAMFLFSGVAAVIFMMLGGIKLITSGGEPTKVEQAKKTLTFAVIGLVIIILSYTGIELIVSITGSDCIKNLGFGC